MFFSFSIDIYFCCFIYLFTVVTVLLVDAFHRRHRRLKAANADFTDLKVGTFFVFFFFLNIDFFFFGRLATFTCSRRRSDFGADRPLISEAPSSIGIYGFSAPHPLSLSLYLFFHRFTKITQQVGNGSIRCEPLAFVFFVGRRRTEMASVSREVLQCDGGITRRTVEFWADFGKTFLGIVGASRLTSSLSQLMAFVKWY